jgi:hypothetical protein
VRLESAFRLLFVVYCLEAGLFLVVLPWTPTWERLGLLLLPILELRTPFGEAWLRGLVTGFGGIHLIWAVHDVDLMLRRSPTA